MTRNEFKNDHVAEELEIGLALKRENILLLSAIFQTIEELQKREIGFEDRIKALLEDATAAARTRGWSKKM